MKKIMFIVILSFLASIIHAQTLDTAIGSAATEVSGRLPRGSTVVMIEFETNSDDLANHVIDEMNHKLVTIGLIRPVERRRLNTVRSELSLNTRGEVSDDFAQRIGHMLGAQYIILGSISSTGNQYVLRFRAITTETANIVWSFSQNIRSDTVLENFLRNSGSRTASSGAGQAATTSTAQAAPTATTYQIGDRGPAGGWVFYDKGIFSEGWQYLEAIPVDFEFTSAWGETASADVASLIVRGYKGWRLPTRIELNQMYVNLKQKKLGDFKDATYWSSSENGSSAWSQGFHNGSQYSSYKGQTYLVRAIRQF